VRRGEDRKNTSVPAGDGYDDYDTYLVNGKNLLQLRRAMKTDTLQRL